MFLVGITISFPHYVLKREALLNILAAFSEI